MKRIILSVSLVIALFSMLQAQPWRIKQWSYYYYENGRDPVPHDSIVFNYDGNRGGDLITEKMFATTWVGFSYSTLSNHFNIGDLSTYTFDDRDNVLTKLDQYWDDIEHKYLNSSKEIYEYNADNQVTLDSTIYYDDDGISSGPWRVLYHIYNNHLLTTTIYNQYDYLTHVYTGASRDQYTYTGNNLKSTQLFQYWKANLQQWQNNNQTTWYYNALGFDTSRISQSYNVNTSTWKNTYRTDNKYNADSTLASYIQFTNSNPGEINTWWDTTSRTTYTYDANRNKIKYERDNHSTGFGFVFYQRENFTFNNRGQCIFEESLEYKSNKWTHESDSYFYYEDYDLPTATDNLPLTETSLKLYPNPSTNMVQVNATLPTLQPVQVSLYNHLGQNVYSLDLGAAKRFETSIPVTNLPAGLYTLTVQQGSYVRNEKMVVGK